MFNSKVVYRVNCKECKEFYIGMTTRRLIQRISEHSENASSAIFKHFVESKHDIAFNSPDILAKDCNKFRLAILIKENCAYLSLNGNTGSTQLNLRYIQ